LEYASGGDLHTLLKKNGSLDHDSVRFVIGEVTSALASIHEIGLVYADLKPENIVITETGHVKLTDFGGSRPVTEAAKQMIGDSAKNVLDDLRDGDWKSRERKTKTFDMDDDDDDDDHAGGFREYNADEDLRIEGTTIYLPPEVVMGAFPSPAADSWALGCVLFQCLTGRPPILDDDENQAKSRIVSFDPGETKSNEDSLLFGDSHASSVEPSARDLIVHLLDRQSGKRPTMTQVAEHDFFQDAGIDVFSLHQKPAHPLDVGDVAPPGVDASWSRRQLSSIWAPQPQAYDISLGFQAKEKRVSGHQSSGPIPEGEEAPAFFSKSNISPSARSQVVPLPPRKKPVQD